MLIVLNLKKVLCQASSRNWQRCGQADIRYKPGATAPKRGAAMAQDNGQTIPVMLQVAEYRMACSALHSRAGLGKHSTAKHSTAQHSLQSMPNTSQHCMTEQHVKVEATQCSMAKPSQYRNWPKQGMTGQQHGRTSIV